MAYTKRQNLVRFEDVLFTNLDHNFVFGFAKSQSPEI
jgi:hypothetical protein